MKKKAVFLVGLYCLLFVSSYAAQQIEIFSNFGPADVYSTSADTVSCENSGGSWYKTYRGMAFTPSKGGLFLDYIEIGLTFNYGTNDADAYIMSDNIGKPGAILETFRLNGVIPTYAGIQPPVKVISQLNPELEVGKQYWIVFTPRPNQYSLFNWHRNSTGYSGLGASTWSVNGSMQSWSTGTHQSVFRVVGLFSGCARPRSDIDGDCKVTLADFAIMASEWMDCGLENQVECWE